MAIHLVLILGCAGNDRDTQVRDSAAFRGSSASAFSELVKELRRVSGADVVEARVGPHRSDATIQYGASYANPDSAFASLSRVADRMWTVPEFGRTADTVAITISRADAAGLIERNTYYYYRSERSTSTKR